MSLPLAGEELIYGTKGQLSLWQNQPTSPTQTVNYLYDGSGNRVAMQSTVDGTTTLTSYIGSIEEVQTSGSSTQTTTYYAVGGKRVAADVNGTFYYFGYDALGSQVAVLNSTGSLVGAQLYGPYGASRYNTGTLPTSIGFTGQRADRVTGLDYYNARFYDPAVGQFLSVDSVQGNGQGMDPYAYVGGNPESRTDPSGNLPYDPATGQIAIPQPNGTTVVTGYTTGEDGTYDPNTYTIPTPSHSSRSNPALRPKSKTITPKRSQSNQKKGSQCSADCQSNNLAIMSAREQLAGTIGQDVVSLLLYMLSAATDFIASDAVAEVIDLTNVVLGLATLGLDIAAWEHATVPAWLTNMIAYTKIAVGVLNVAINFLPLVGGFGAVLGAFKGGIESMGKIVGGLVSDALGIGGGLVNVYSGGQTLYGGDIPPQDTYQDCLALGGEGCRSS